MTIRAVGLSKSFDGGKNFALRNVTVQINRGEFVAIIGLSGAGKSTFLRTLNGAVKPDQGQLEVLGQKLENLKPSDLVRLRKEIGFIFQQFNLLKTLSVLENTLVGRVAFVPLWRSLLGFFPASDRALAKQVLDSVGLEGRYHEKLRNLSGGQQQRVAIARALVQEPQIILADEPMASLDPRLAELVIEMLAKINREQQITTVMNIHSLELAKKYAGRLLGFHSGELIFDGTPAQLSKEIIDKIYRFDAKETH